MRSVADLEDVRRLALALPETQEAQSYGLPAWQVRSKTFVWERPLRPADLEELGNAAPRGTVLAAYVADVGVKQALLQSDSDVVLTTPHFDGYPIVLVRLDVAHTASLEELVVDAWLARAPKRLAHAFLAAR